VGAVREEIIAIASVQVRAVGQGVVAGTAREASAAGQAVVAVTARGARLTFHGDRHGGFDHGTRGQGGGRAALLSLLAGDAG
jgi:CO/xanthine dehydrogenase FAD-binding subunit